MPRAKKIEISQKSKPTSLRTSGPKESIITSGLSLSQRIQEEFKSNQSYLSLVLGLLIVLVIGILVFSYLKKEKPTLGPAGQIVSNNEVTADVTPGNLPGKYTVKEGDTLFLIADKYYKDGYKFTQIAEANKLADVNLIDVGQVLDIPALAETKTTGADNTNLGTGGAVNQTAWGEAITGDTYTVADGDWLSKIAGRAYGDIMAFDKIAKANNITDPNLIEPGTVLSIPR